MGKTRASFFLICDRMLAILPMFRNPKSLYQVSICLILSVSQFSFGQARQAFPNRDSKTPSGAGRSAFNSSCAGCHGLDGRGSDKAVNISENVRVRRLSDAQLSSIISNGVPGTGMPAFRNLPERQVRALVSYLRSLQGRDEAHALTGDAKRGREIFFGKGDCSSCHMISGLGGFLGPDLTNHGASSSPSAIRDEIMRSPRVPPPGYRAAVLTTASGERLEGLIRNEDNFSVQLQTKDGRFHFLTKAELQEIEYLNASLMPADYRDRLSDGELNDLVSYLMAIPGSNSKATPHQHEDDTE